jgi:hypothetical protein
LPSTTTAVDLEYQHSISDEAARRWLDGENG